MDCWLASFPRSGNTFFRNILYYVYGVESSTWHKEAYPIDEKYDQFRFIKTHLLPDQLSPNDPSIPAIYIVRDGRDAVVSIAHHRKDLVMPGSDFNLNLQEAIVAAEGSFFGGWSQNVAAWLQRAQVVIRYEDLITDPATAFKRVENLIALPSANWENLPGFAEMKAGKAKYGSASKITDIKIKPVDFSEKFFRKGKSGGWKDEMPEHFQDLFWNYHGDMMERLGYETYPGSIGQNPILDYSVMKKMGIEVPQVQTEKINVYIESTKLAEPVNDGVKRYLEHLLKGFEDVLKYGDGRWNFKLLIARKIYPLENYKEAIRIEEIEKLHVYERILLGFKKYVKIALPEKIYKPISNFYKKTDVRILLRKFQQKISINSMKSINENIILKDKVDLLHIPLPQNSKYFKAVEHPYIVTVHDMTHKMFPEFHEQVNISLAEAGMEFIVEKNTDVIAVSQNTINDLVSNYTISNENIHLIYEAPDQSLFRWNVNKDLAENIRLKYKLGTTPYFLCLSTIEPRKNLPNTIRAFNMFVSENPAAEINLVISGNYGWKTEHLSEELHLDNPRIIFTGYVDDIDLPVIYSEAIALCYISFYEGFGLPPIEAMSCRTPVIYGDNSSMKEVIGNAGLPADPYDLIDIKTQMHRMFFDPSLRNKLAVLSHHKSFGFSWRKSIYETLKIYVNKVVSSQ